MKYNFLNSGKKLTSDNIKSQMNFDNVVKGASIWAGVKLGFNLLKLGPKVSGGFLVGASAVIITTATLVVVNPDFSSKLNGEESFIPEPKKELIAVRPDSTSSISSFFKSNSLDSLVRSVDSISQAGLEEPSSESQILIPVPEQLVVVDSIQNVDVKTKARPLPDFSSFQAFIDKELNYPIGPISVSVNENDEDITQEEGYVEVFWTINKQGKAKNFKIMKSMGDAFDNEAIRVIKSFKRWEPATYNGEAVESNLKLKVHFKIK